MREHTKRQCGSPSRDRFKRCHKEIGASFYALDLDLVLIEKYPAPGGIVAVIDYKNASGPDDPYDQISFAEAVGYNDVLKMGIGVYLVYGRDPESFCFNIYRYLGGNPKPNPPVCDLRYWRTTTGKQDFADWERYVRRSWRERKMREIRQQEFD
jgi:hypothetical protein